MRGGGGVCVCARSAVNAPPHVKRGRDSAGLIFEKRPRKHHSDRRMAFLMVCMYVFFCRPSTPSLFAAVLSIILADIYCRHCYTSPFLSCMCSHIILQQALTTSRILYQIIPIYLSVYVLYARIIILCKAHESGSSNKAIYNRTHKTFRR